MKKRIGLNLVAFSLVVLVASAFTKKTDLYWFDINGTYTTRHQTTTLELQYLESTYTTLDFNTTSGTLFENGYTTNPASGTPTPIYYTQP